MIRKIAAATAVILFAPAAHGFDGLSLGFWELSAAVWDNRGQSTADLGLTPVLRAERDALYLEGAIGLHLVTRQISAD